jgi:hypothetical protein
MHLPLRYSSVFSRCFTCSSEDTIGVVLLLSLLIIIMICYRLVKRPKYLIHLATQGGRGLVVLSCPELATEPRSPAGRAGRGR